MKDKNMEQFKAAIMPELIKIKNIGIEIGYYSCLISIYRKIRSLTSAKNIKDVIKIELEKSKTRVDALQQQSDN